VTIGVGIIGLGIMGRRMQGMMDECPEMTIVRGFDPNPAMVADSGLDAAASADDLVTAPDVDLVYIACPPLWHGEHARRALAAGKPVLCEKPLGVDIADSRRLVEEFDAAGVQGAVNFSFAGTPSRRWLKDLVEAGAPGTITGIDIRLHFAQWPRDWQEAAAWLGKRDQGGYVREVLSHFIYLTHSILGPARVVEAWRRYPDGPGGEASESHVSALLDLDGIPVSIAGGSGGVGPDRIEYTLWGSKESFRLDDWYTAWRSDGGPWRRDQEHIADPRAEGRQHQAQAIADWAHGRPSPMPDLALAFGVQKLIEIILGAGPTA